MDRAAELRHPDELADLVGTEVVEALEGEVLLFNLLLLLYSVVCYQTSSRVELVLANLSCLLISGFFNNFLVK